MKKTLCLIILISFLIIYQEIKSQYCYIYDSYGNIIYGSNWNIKKGKSVTLYDFATQTKFVLDSTRTVISAFDKKGKLKWKTNPYKDKKIPEYRTNNPIIVNFSIRLTENYYRKRSNQFTTEISNYFYTRKILISISYNNSQFGTIDLQDGYYYFMGQD